MQDSLIAFFQLVTLGVCFSYIVASGYKNFRRDGETKTNPSVIAFLSLFLASVFIIKGISHLGNYCDLVVTLLLGPRSVEDMKDNAVAFLQIAVLITFSVFMSAFARSLYTVTLLDNGIWWRIVTFGDLLKRVPLSTRSAELILRAGVLFFFTLHQASINRLSAVVIPDARAEGMGWLAAVRSWIERLDLTQLYYWPRVALGYPPEFGPPIDYKFEFPTSAYDLSDQRIADIQQIILSLGLSTIVVAMVLLVWSIAARKVAMECSQQASVAREQFWTQFVAFICLAVTAVWLILLSRFEIASRASGAGFILVVPEWFPLVTFVVLVLAFVMAIWCIAPQVWRIVCNVVPGSAGERCT